MNRTIRYQAISKIRQFSTGSKLLAEVRTKPKPTLRFTEQRREIGPFGWFLLVCIKVDCNSLSYPISF